MKETKAREREENDTGAGYSVESVRENRSDGMTGEPRPKGSEGLRKWRTEVETEVGECSVYSRNSKEAEQAREE